MAFRRTRIQSLHYNPQQGVPLGLKLAEFFYALGVQCRLAMYRCKLLPIHRLPVPVISIGNLTTGGTGKTPVVIALAQFLEQRGLKVAILSRGYGGEVKTRFHEADNPKYGDEPYLIQQRLTRSRVYVGSDRAFTGKKAIEKFCPNVILLDDGFQHIRLHRDLNILLVDGEHGFGNEYQLPAGPLREPLSEMRRADWILLTKTIEEAQEAMVQQCVQRFQLGEKIHVDRCPFEVAGVLHPESKTFVTIDDLNGKSVVLLSGIAQPGTFESMISQKTSAEVIQHHVFPDHANYTHNDLVSVEEQLLDYPKALLVTTEKDWVKLKDVLSKFFQHRVHVLRVQPMFDWGQLVNPLFPQVTTAYD